MLNEALGIGHWALVKIFSSPASTRVGILHCREGKTWGTRKDSGQGRKTVQNHILLVTKRPLCGENLPCLLSLLVFLVLPQQIILKTYPCLPCLPCSPCFLPSPQSPIPSHHYPLPILTPTQLQFVKKLIAQLGVSNRGTWECVLQL